MWDLPVAAFSWIGSSIAQISSGIDPGASGNPGLLRLALKSSWRSSRVGSPPFGSGVGDFLASNSALDALRSPISWSESSLAPWNSWLARLSFLGLWSRLELECSSSNVRDFFLILLLLAAASSNSVGVQSISGSRPTTPKSKATATTVERARNFCDQMTDV